MRLDKFLKNSRLIKRRTVAKEACEAGRVLVNEKVAKPGTEVQIGDRICIRFASRPIVVEVLDTREVVRKEETQDLYRVCTEERT